MKSKHALNGLLLATTMLIAPIGAAAQDASETVLPTAPVFTDEIIVRGRNIPEPQRATSQVATFLSAEDLTRTGDDNAALALTRLSGLSVVGGRFAYVRGLGDRYSAARLNGSLLPSPEPLRRTVPLDLFPSNILQGAVVQKTYSANYPGEFGGGMIDLQTLRRPDESFVNVKLGVGMNLETTGKNGVFVRGGDLDWLGYDDGLRDIPEPLDALIKSGTPLNALTPAERETVGESLVNSPLLVIQQGTLGPNWEASIDGGTSVDLGGDLTLGLVGVAGYKQDWETERAVRQRVSGDILGNDFESVETSLNATVNALGSASLSWGEHLVQTTLLYIHSGRKESQILEGFNTNSPGTGQVLDERSSWLERQLSFAQLRGEHGLGDFEINWRASAARSKRDTPYEQFLRRIKNADGVPLYSQANNRTIDFSDLTDDALGGGIDLVYHAPFSGPREATITLGYEYSNNEREYNLLALRFAGGNSLPPDVQAARPDFLFSPDNIDPARFFLIETQTSSDSYKGEMTIHAGYGQIDAELIPTVRTTVGVRYEDADQSVITFNRFAAFDPDPRNFGPSTELLNDYWLPSGTVTWNFTDNMQFRVGYSHTIARPQFRELSPSLFFDPENDRSYRGNRFLVDSEFRNYDARYEYYLGRNQFLTLAGFYKTIENPIEEIQFESTQFEFDTTFINSPRARLFGGEAEYRTRFAIGWNDWFDRRDWLFSANYTYTNSEIRLKDGDTVINPFSGAPQSAELFGLDGAPLQGTPKHIVNSQFGWEGENDQFTVLLGWVGERILQRGSPNASGGIPDVIEKPGIQLDVVYRYDIALFGADATIGLAARNLTGTRHEEFQLSNATESGRTEFDTYDRGRSLSASLTARF
ncbi:TonB-dependent receptor domain-containing protein [Amphiplicatus metriothermophilus]|uniref:TonB-dependent receptor n=1 Tax=Amphiplicatus metriothermophilus TaxID=1519374 RepID=A0A239PQ59_9PROT|nr:TonB-dependent receptor [Amphiplicatus metriothermophilus]MBB5518763.1 outer membrane receptor protein involved in Fe transport [Amphiplicatus metriothermophilus]SNT72082.1 TonB-dependent receptor [Amphiplicatus metriothermophilus]